MSKEKKKSFATLLSVAELAKVTGGRDPIPSDPPPDPGDVDDIAGGS